MEMKNHLPQIDDEKLKFVVEIKDKYNAGEIPLAEAKKLLKEKVKTLKPYEIALAEQKLKAFDENECRKEDIQSMMQLFDEVMDTSRPDLPSNHPIMCYYRENDEVKEIVEIIKEKRNQPFIKNQWAELYDKLTLWWKHHLARKQNQLYPLLEKKGFDRPTTTMWVLDDYVRDTIKEGKKLLDEDKDEEFLKFQITTIVDVIDLIQKEETVLYPTSLAMIREEEFEDMKIGDREIGFSFEVEESHNENILENKNETSNNSQNGFAEDLSKLLSKYGYSAGNNNTVFDVAMGKLTLEQINLIYKNLPVDITYVDENEIVKFYSDTKHRVFPRSKNVIGREVKNCHPRKSVHIVEEIFDKFRRGEQDTAEFWINKPDLFIYIYYVAVRDEKGNFRGVMEMMQDCTHIRSLQGSRTLLTWENENSEVSEEIEENNVEENIENEEKQINIEDINKDTYLKDLLNQFSFLKDELTTINQKFSLLKTPLAKLMLPTATIEKMAEKSGMDTQELLTKIKELIKNNI